jgi:hypothetical protein
LYVALIAIGLVTLLLAYRERGSSVAKAGRPSTQVERAVSRRRYNRLRAENARLQLRQQAVRAEVIELRATVKVLQERHEELTALLVGLEADRERVTTREPARLAAEGRAVAYRDVAARRTRSKGRGNRLDVAVAGLLPTHPAID